MSRHYLFALAVSSLLAGCTVTTTPSPYGGSGTSFPSSDDATYNYLFDDARSTPTPNTITGIWGTEDADGKYRFEFKADKLVIAGRCGADTIGNDSTATFTNDHIATTQPLFVASNINGNSCGVSFPQLDAKTCAALTTTTTTNTTEDACFTLSGTTLTLKNVSSKDLVLTKISD